jgi:hypothetical protein
MLAVTFLTLKLPLEKPLEIADYMFCPLKKITSRTELQIRDPVPF